MEPRAPADTQSSVLHATCFPIQARSPGLKRVRLTGSRGPLRCGATAGIEVGLEAHVDQVTHLRRSKVHQSCITPASLQDFRFGAGPERLHLLFDLKHDLAPALFAELELPRQPHPTLLLHTCSQQKRPRLPTVPIPCRTP